MSDVLERVEGVPEWGVDPIPQSERTLSGFDLAILWGDLGVGLLVLVTGGFLVPGLGFAAAFAAIVIGSVIGVSLLALAGSAGAGHGITTMVLFRPVLGVRGSWFPSALNVVQLIGWTAVELWAMSLVADIVSREIFGFSARWMWLGIVAVVCVGLALWGPVGVARIWMKRFGAWVIGGIVIAVTLLAFTLDGIGDALRAPGSGAPFGPALDLVIAMPISWLPLVCDYNRFGRGARSAFTGTFWGYLIANVWLYSLGAMLVLGTGAEPSPAGIATAILAVVGGSIAGLTFLAALLVGETDEAFADIYSAALSLKNVFPRASLRALVIGIGAISVVLAAWLTMERFEAFLFLLGSVFVPLFGILAADHFVNRRGAIQVDQLDAKNGAYWFTGGVRLSALLPWVGGFLVYHWILPVGPGSWIDLVGRIVGDPLIVRFPWLSASIAAFVLSFVTSIRPSKGLSSAAPGTTAR